MRDTMAVMDVQFYDRGDELAALERRWESTRAEWLIVWGRRRVGKTELLSRLLEGRRGLLFEAPRGAVADQLRDLSELLADKSGNRLLREQSLSSWRAALAAIEQFVGRERTIVVFDEYQRLAKTSEELGSLLNRWWRETARRLPLVLILSGSEISFFRTEILESPADTYGRRTGQLQVEPFDYLGAAEFFPTYSAEDRLRAYAICGGMPYYLEQFDPRQSVGDNIFQAVLARDGVLNQEVELLLHEELPEPDAYFSVLRAIAAGCTRFGQIQARTGIEGTNLTRALDTLMALFLIEKRVPVTLNPARTNKTLYEIRDNYVGFWFRFCHPFLSHLETVAAARQHLDQRVLPELDHHVSAPAFERVCRRYLQLAHPGVASVGEWWGAVRTGKGRQTEQRQVDVVAVDSDRKPVALGSCKWTSGPVGMEEVRLLDQSEPWIKEGLQGLPRYFFSRNGFTEELRRLADAAPGHYHLVTPDDLLAIGKPVSARP